MAAPAPFKVAVPEAELKYLKQKLAAARELPEQLEDIAPWEDGTDLNYFKVCGVCAVRLCVLCVLCACVCLSFH